MTVHPSGGPGAPYWLSLSIPMLAWAGAYGVGQSWLLPVFMLVVLPVLDRVPHRSASSRGVGHGTPLLVAWAVLHVVALGWVLYQVGVGSLGPVSFAGSLIGCGLMSSVGFAVAHELIHRRHQGLRGLGEAQLVLMLYPHFQVEHLFDHHRTAATPDDVATARQGESYYRFLRRSVIGGFLNAVRIESSRLRRRGRTPWSFANVVVRGLTLDGALAVVLAVVGVDVLVFWVGQGVIAIAIQEAINYMQHYGLQRRRVAPDRYEPMSARCAWESDRWLSNCFLFNVQLHAAHHCSPSHSFDRLVARDDAPRLPNSYPVLLLRVFVPALWFRAIDPLLLLSRSTSRVASTDVPR